MAKTINQLVLEVLAGEWGSGDARKQKLEAAGYNYTVVQKRVNEVAEHMKTRKEAMKPWFDACKAQWEWSYNAKYNWGKWQKDIASSKNWGTCITYPNVVAMRCGLIKEKGKIITSSGSDNDSKSTTDSFYANSVKAMASINSKYWSSIKYPNKTTAQLVKEGLIKEGDIIGFMGHTTSYAGKDSKGNLLFNNAGHAAGISDNSKPGSQRAVLNQKCNYKNRLVLGVFSVNTFIVLTSCTNGTITYSDRYMAGQDVTVTIKPESGKVVTSIKVNGKAVTPTTSYKISKIDSNYIIEVVCEKSKTIEELAKEVLDGKWGSGNARKTNLEKVGYDYNAIQNKVNEILASKLVPKTIDELAQEVLDGKWGSGSVRESKLKAAGHDYNAVQKKVNELIAAKETVLIEKLAQEVLQGKWGSGDKRKENLQKAGYDYNKVQKRVNELIAAQKESSSSTPRNYPGVLPTYHVTKTNAQVIADTIKWAKWIASDNRFHYGKGDHAHHNGCYFCGTQRMKKGHGIVDPELTYCCNPFVGAAWAHGGLIPKALSMCQNTSSWDFNKGHGYDASSLFTNLGHPVKSNLKAGDVLCRDTHVALYIGNGKIAEASGGDDNKKNSSSWNNSIRIRTLTDSNYANFPRVHRYNSSVNADILMRHGEAGDRVTKWQAFLDWYYDGQVGSADGLFGDNTLKWTKKFQEEVIGKGEGDGIVGPKTLAAAANVKK